MQQSVDSIRQSARWLIGSFAAVGAILAAGVSLSDVGTLHGWRLALAVLGATGALTAVVIALWQVSTILIPRLPLLDELSEHAGLKELLAREPEMLHGYASSLPELIDMYRRCYTPLREAETAARTSFGEDDILERHVTVARERVEELEAAINRYRQYAVYLDTVNAFSRARKGVAAAVVLGGAAIVLFAYAANPPAKQSTATRSPVTHTSIAG